MAMWGEACVRVKLITSPPGSKRGGKGPAVPFKGLLKFPKDLSLSSHLLKV